MLSCTALQPTASRSWSVFRALPPGLFCRRQGGPTPHHYCQLHWLPVQQRITYKLAMLTFNIRRTETPAYLSRLITARVCGRTLRSSTVPRLSVPFHKTTFSRRAFRCTAPTTWNSLPNIVTAADSLASFNLG